MHSPAPEFLTPTVLRTISGCVLTLCCALPFLGVPLSLVAIAFVLCATLVVITETINHLQRQIPPEDRPRPLLPELFAVAAVILLFLFLVASIPGLSLPI